MKNQKTVYILGINSIVKEEPFVFRRRFEKGQEIIIDSIQYIVNGTDIMVNLNQEVFIIKKVKRG
jgi:hypothetical protein